MATSKKRPLTPAIRRLLAHALASGGAWLARDAAPYRIALQAVEAAEKRGLVAIDRNRDGEVSGARITSKGCQEMGVGGLLLCDVESGPVSITRVA